MDAYLELYDIIIFAYTRSPLTRNPNFVLARLHHT